jgi:hypothetical protein
MCSVSTQLASGPPAWFNANGCNEAPVLSGLETQSMHALMLVRLRPGGDHGEGGQAADDGLPHDAFPLSRGDR